MASDKKTPLFSHRGRGGEERCQRIGETKKELPKKVKDLVAQFIVGEPGKNISKFILC